MRKELVEKLLSAAQNVVHDAEKMKLHHVRRGLEDVYHIDAKILETLHEVVHQISDEAVETIKAIQAEARKPQAAVLTEGTVYKVWIEVEEYDIKRGEGHTDDCLPFSATATFRTEDEAVAFAEKLHEAFIDVPNAVQHE